MLTNAIHRTILIFAVSMLLCEHSFAQKKETVEPPALYRLYVNGQPIGVQLGKEFKLNINAPSQLKMKLLAAPSRRFRYAGLDFPYPKNFAFEAELEADSKIWTLEGTDVTLMIFEFPDRRVTHEALAREITAQWEQSDFSSIKFDIPDLTLAGTKAISIVAGFEIQQSTFNIPTKDGSRLLVVQDTMDEDGKPTQEYRKVLRLLKSKLKLTRR